MGCGKRILSWLENLHPFLKNKINLGKNYVESAATAALKLLTMALKLSDDLITCGRTAGASVVLTATSKLLLGINPRSGKPDHMLNIARYVLYGDWMPEARYCAVKILTYVAASPSNQPDLLATFTASSAVSNAVLKAFTDALDAHEEEEHAGDSLPGSRKGFFKTYVMKLILNF